MTKNTNLDFPFNPTLSSLSGHTPFSRPFSLKKIKLGQYVVEIMAQKNECIKIAKQLGIPEIIDLTASFTLNVTENKKILLSGNLKSRLSQICSISLEKFIEDIKAEFTFLLEPCVRSVSKQTTAQKGSLLNSTEDFLDLTESLLVYNQQVNLGEIAFEQLALSLNPWPRKPDVTFSFTENLEEQSTTIKNHKKNSPFDVLKKLQKKI